MSKRLTTEEFIKKAKSIHGNKYDYSAVVYENARKNITIICKQHSEFKQLPMHHTRGSGCPKCSGNITLTKEEFVTKANKIHAGKYDYSKVKFSTNQSKILIICKEHDYEFEQVQANHLGGNGCPKCKGNSVSKKLSMSSSLFFTRANKVHDSIYQYDTESFKGAKSNIRVKCSKHGWFMQIADNHIRGHGCGKCINKTEGRIAQYLLKREITFREYKIKDKFYDFYLPKHNLLIERDGEQHYGSKNFSNLVKIEKSEYTKLQQKNDKYKTKIAKEKGFKIARIPYWLTKKEEEIEIENILAGKPTYPDVPDLKQEKTKPRPVNNF